MIFKQRDKLDKTILGEFSRALRIATGLPSRVPFLLRTFHAQRKAAKIRKQLADSGLEVPPILIMSITKRCNLNCAGCYSRALHQEKGEELSALRCSEIFAEAEELGISIILLAGGEPLLRKDVLEAAAKHPRIIFPVFTNGLLLDRQSAVFFGNNPSLVPVLSMEGEADHTDTRRGDGVFAILQHAIDRLTEQKTFWGMSITLTSANFELVLSPEYISGMVKQGCRLFFFVEYVPVQPGSESNVLNNNQKYGLSAKIETLNASHPAIFIPLPGEEDRYDGCLAAGRGFIHINPWGKVEPCPFAPFSDTDLSFSGLRDALASGLLAKIREKHALLSEGEGGCALWANRNLIQELIAEQASGKTGAS